MTMKAEALGNPDILSSTFGIQHMLNDPLYLLIIVYLLIQPKIRKWSEHSRYYERNKKFVKNLMAGYNLLMVIFSAASSISMIYCLIHLEKGIYSTEHFKDKKVGELYRNIVYCFYISKYIEFLDTFNLILCNRPVSWLHYLHQLNY